MSTANGAWKIPRPVTLTRPRKINLQGHPYQGELKIYFCPNSDKPNWGCIVSLSEQSTNPQSNAS